MTLSVPYQPNLIDFLVKELTFILAMNDGIYFSGEGEVMLVCLAIVGVSVSKSVI